MEQPERSKMGLKDILMGTVYFGVSTTAGAALGYWAAPTLIGNSDPLSKERIAYTVIGAVVGFVCAKTLQESVKQKIWKRKSANLTQEAMQNQINEVPAEEMGSQPAVFRVQGPA